MKADPQNALDLTRKYSLESVKRKTDEPDSQSVARSSGFIARVAKHEAEFAARLRAEGHDAQTPAHGFPNAGDFGATKGHFGFVVKDQAGDVHAFVIDPALKRISRGQLTGSSAYHLLAGIRDLRVYRDWSHS